MIVQILSNTPTWVFALFFGLLALGLMQTRTRRVGKVPAFLLPAGMVALSLAGIESSFGLRPVSLAVIMAIFFAKYTYAVIRAIDPKVGSDPLFVAAVSGVYGSLSGYFAARVLNLVMKARAAGAAPAGVISATARARPHP